MSYNISERKKACWEKGSELMKKAESGQLNHEAIHVLDNLELYFRVCDDAPNFIAPHWHGSIEIIYVRGGRMEVSEESRHTILDSGDFILINSKSVHSTHWNERLGWYLLQIPQTFIEKYAPEAKGLEFFPEREKNPEAFSELQRILEGLPLVYSQEGGFTSLLFLSEILRLLHILCRYFSESSQSEGRKSLERLEPILDFIKKHYAEPISLSDAAKKAGLNNEYFCRFFKKNMGVTFLEYLNSVRLEHIYNDLLKTDKTLTELLSLHGFTNYKLFSRLFKKSYGASPSEIRSRRIKL